MYIYIYIYNIKMLTFEAAGRLLHVPVDEITTIGIHYKNIYIYI